jgi:hypothetical protein
MLRACRKSGRGSVLIVAAALLMSACAASGASTSTITPNSGSATIPVAVTASPSATSFPTSFPIPNGTFDTTATRQEALDKGFSNKEIDKSYGLDGKLPLTIVLDGSTYQVFVVGDDGVKERGDMGTYTATKTLWVATDESEGCSGCVLAYRWSIHSQVLSLKLLSDSGGPADFRDVRLVTEHDYVKAG